MDTPTTDHNVTCIYRWYARKRQVRKASKKDLRRISGAVSPTSRQRFSSGNERRFGTWSSLQVGLRRIRDRRGLRDRPGCRDRSRRSAPPSGEKAALETAIAMGWRESSAARSCLEQSGVAQGRACETLADQTGRTTRDETN